ncbi:hypothetical protein BDQ94DRAFT_175461 [Aspergillus welwitschiae]|uniref:Homologous-pairing protein 2 winged helix domain-containing protein n=1 Tax=Aspergillus welwitschiae TaxID=1341132 RepID=A0A3F3PL36_9EURO|nr:hypothetical protein BDQ94DRAFT_175461 [Aspergillus welwitschiae]RDH27641.1 hypothetical protein BDQ94DRAFT_175461 [Aspergillus welwitschiae]
MAQRKAKNEKQLGAGATAPDGPALVLDYLPHAVKALRELHKNKLIEGRAAGKQIVYHALQERSDEVTPEIIAALHEQAEKLQEQVTGLEAAEKKTRAELATICARPLVSELRRDVGQLEQELEAIHARLVQARGSDAGTVPVRVKLDAQRVWKHWQNQANVRGRICRDLWRMCTEVVPDNMDREELWMKENLGLEGPFPK